MKTKIKLSILILFISLASKGQYNWMQQIISTSNDTLVSAEEIAFDSFNHPYVIGLSYFSNDNNLLHFNGNSWDSIITNINFARNMVFDKNEKLWFNVYPDILGYLNTFTNAIVKMPMDPLLSGHYPLDLTIDSNNNKWILTRKFTSGNMSINVVKFDGSTYTVFDSTITGVNVPLLNSYSDKPIKIVATKNSSILYVIAEAGYVSNYNGATWTKLDSTNSSIIPGVLFKDAVIDDNDNLWILAWTLNDRDFLIKYDGIQFLYYYQTAAISNISVELNSLAVDTNNNLWCTENSYGLIKFDGTNWTAFPSYPQIGTSYPDYPVLVVDKKGNIWSGDIDGLSLYPISVFNENGFQTIDGNVFKDVNANGVHDVSENGIPHEMVRSSEGMCASTDSTGNYHLYFTDSTNTITVTHNLKKYRYHSTIPTSYSINPLSQNTTGKDFGVAEVTNVNDLQIYSNMFPTRPGFVSYGNISYNNIGTTTLSDTITLQLDGRYTFLNSNPVPTIINGNTLQWLYTNLAPLDYGHISLQLRVDSTAVIGDTLFSLATIGPVISDTVPSDNMNFIYKVVHGSYDPNEKEVEPKGTGPNGNIPNGQTLNYTIHFQNTGTDTAFTVTVKDTLSSNLDINTFQFTGSSHPCIYEITGAGNMKFTFYNILLTDTFTNEPMSHGYVSYKIKAIDNLPLGTEIKNTAFIYFDFNAPIVTNTTLNTIANTTGIPFMKNDYSANVFPNPLQDVATLEINGMNLNSKLTVKLYDAMGREMNVAISKMDNNRFAIHRNDLTSGLYFYQVSDGTVLISSGKITVQ